MTDDDIESDGVRRPRSCPDCGSFPMYRLDGKDRCADCGGWAEP